MACGGKGKKGGKAVDDALRMMEGKIPDTERDFLGDDPAPSRLILSRTVDADVMELPIEVDRDLMADVRPIDIELPTTTHPKVAGAHPAARPVRIKQEQHGGATRFAEHKLNACDVYYHNRSFTIQHLHWVT